MNLSRWPSEPDHATEYLLYQTLFGAHPLPLDRALTFVHKAVREGKVHTSWRDPDETYESDLEAFVQAVLGDPAFLSDLDHLCASTAVAARLGSLAQVLVKLTMPGVPDLYQGAEAWHLRLVDPDNRAPVDAGGLRALASAATAGRIPDLAADDEGVAKWALTRGVLRLRRDHPEAFGPDGGYDALGLAGDAARGALAFVRGGRVAVVARTRPVAAAAGGWGATTVALPPGQWRPALVPGEAVAGRADLAALDGVGFGTVLVKAG
jgi:(1->4)-alpha-D-glucan 1-alpha-D-glucosylmutase